MTMLLPILFFFLHIHHHHWDSLDIILHSYYGKQLSNMCMTSIFFIAYIFLSCIYQRSKLQFNHPSHDENVPLCIQIKFEASILPYFNGSVPH